jgi:hypothetical protein
VGAGGEMNQALYAHMNNKRKMKKKRKHIISKPWGLSLCSVSEQPSGPCQFLAFK